MARRSDHSRPDLEALIVDEAERQIVAVGAARFSAREVAKQVGYSVGTIYNVFGSLDRLLLAVNGRTMARWTDALAQATKSKAGEERLAALVSGYFAFARDHNHAWAAIYAHRTPPGEALSDDYLAARARLIGLVEDEVRSALPGTRIPRAPALARSLLAVVHGHCVFALDGTFALLGEEDPQAAALARVREAIAAV